MSKHGRFRAQQWRTIAGNRGAPLAALARSCRAYALRQSWPLSVQRARFDVRAGGYSPPRRPVLPLSSQYIRRGGRSLTSHQSTSFLAFCIPLLHSSLLRSTPSFCLHPVHILHIAMFAKLAVAFLAFTGASLALPTRSIEARNVGRGQFPFFASHCFSADVLLATYYEPAGGYGACGQPL